jgi:hypothetical protein
MVAKKNRNSKQINHFPFTVRGLAARLKELFQHLRRGPRPDATVDLRLMVAA